MTLFLVGLDGSPSSIDALRYAAKMAESQGAAIRTITTWRIPATYGEMPLAGWNPEDDARTAAQQALRDAFGAHIPANVHSDVLQGNAAQVLLDESKGADLVVVGSRGHGGFAGLLLGSVSSAVAEHATVPVLVFH